MSALAKILAAAAVTIATASVLATVRSAWIDGLDCVVLVASLAVLARIAIRVASDPTELRRHKR